MITLDFVYTLMGLMLAGVAVVNFRDRTSPKRYNNAAFWGLYATIFLVGRRSKAGLRRSLDTLWRVT